MSHIVEKSHTISWSVIHQWWITIGKGSREGQKGISLYRGWRHIVLQAQRRWKPAQTNLVLPRLGLKAARGERVIRKCQKVPESARKCHIQHSGREVWPMACANPASNLSNNPPLIPSAKTFHWSSSIELLQYWFPKFASVFLVSVPSPSQPPSSDIFVVYLRPCKKCALTVRLTRAEEKFVRRKLLPLGICANLRTNPKAAI